MLYSYASNIIAKRFFIIYIIYQYYEKLIFRLN